MAFLRAQISRTQEFLMATNRCQGCFSPLHLSTASKAPKHFKWHLCSCPVLYFCLHHSVFNDTTAYVAHRPDCAAGYQNQTKARHLWVMASSDGALSWYCVWGAAGSRVVIKMVSPSFWHEGAVGNPSRRIQSCLKAGGSQGKDEVGGSPLYL